VTSPALDVLLVPEGFEHRTVLQCLNRSSLPVPLVLAIPIGPVALSGHLHQWIKSGNVFKPASRILLMGLGGALSDRLQVGDGVLINECGQASDGNEIQWTSCDHGLISAIASRAEGIQTGRLITTDCVVCNSREKQRLGLQTQADVVDMEGFTALAILTAAGHHVAILRVVSDDLNHDLPNLATVVSPSGSIQPLPLLLAFVKRPLAAWRLINGSLKALRALGLLTHQLFVEDARSAA
jgi:hypothetical protein